MNQPRPLCTAGLVLLLLVPGVSGWARYMENTARRHDIPLPTLTARELADITRYLAGLGVVAPPKP